MLKTQMLLAHAYILCSQQNPLYKRNNIRDLTISVAPACILLHSLLSDIYMVAPCAYRNVNDYISTIVYGEELTHTKWYLSCQAEKNIRSSSWVFQGICRRSLKIVESELENRRTGNTNGQQEKDKQWSKHTLHNDDRATRTPLKTGGQIRCTFPFLWTTAVCIRNLYWQKKMRFINNLFAPEIVIILADVIPLHTLCGHHKQQPYLYLSLFLQHE